MFNQQYAYPANTKVRFQNFQFYLSDVTLLKEAREDAAGVNLSEVLLYDFREVQTSEAAAKGIAQVLKNVPPGQYKGLRVGIGVSPKLNATSPNSYTPPHPLDDNYWSWALGYVFFKIEGNADVKGDGKFSEKLTFHVGGNDFYRTKTFFQDINIAEGTNRLELSVDLYKVLTANNDTEFVDFRKVTQDHTNDKQLAAFLANNLMQALELSPAAQ